MHRLVVREHGRIYREDLKDAQFEALRRFDDEQASTKGRRIFIWRNDYARARQWVGVLQIPGLNIEILPKVGPPQNLLFMLHRAGELPFRERELASQAARRAPLLEILVTLFTDRLLFELGRGSQHAYLRRQDHQPFLKGKLLVAEQLRRNRDTTPTTQDFQRVRINRQTERFADVFAFARMALEDCSPTGVGGDHRTFSLLFDMNIIFERFVAALFADEILRGPLAGISLHPQASGRIRYLAHHDPTRAAPGVLPLKADLLFERGPHRLIIDTKWKRLDPDKDRRQGVSREDLFQLFAYAHTYNSPQNILLYPRDDADLQEETYFLPQGHRIRVAFLDLDADLWHYHEHITQTLRELLTAVLPAPALAAAVCPEPV